MITQSRNRLLVLALVIAISVMLYFVLVPHLANDQTIRIHYGNGSTQVSRVEVALHSQNTIERSAVFAYPSGAPPAIFWHFSRENGPVTIEVDLSTAQGWRTKTEAVVLDGHEHTIECAADKP